MNYKFEANYDELENSIVDSLSEISIASNLPINIHNQTLLNNTISEVVSLYLWSSDFSCKKQVDTKKKQQKIKTKLDLDKLAWETNSPVTHDNNLSNYSKQITLSHEDNYDDHKKLSPKVVQVNKRSNPITSQLAKDGNKDSKFMIPSLDLSYLSKNADSPDNYQFKNDEKKSLSKQKAYDSTGSIKAYEPQHRSIKDEIEYLLKELKLNKYQSSDINDYYDHDFEGKLNKSDNDKLSTMAINLKDLLTKLVEKRKIAKRNMTVDKMTKEEIQSEKIDTQKELLTFEEKHGRPQTKLEKDLMRPLYDHYRKVKRLISKPNGKVTINEHIEDQDEDEINNLKDHKNFINLHSFSLSELVKEREISIIEKTKLKDLIKKYEIEFAKQTGRALSKEDREYHKDEFERYKVLKAKIKLIDVLIEKSEIGKK